MGTETWVQTLEQRHVYGDTCTETFVQACVRRHVDTTSDHTGYLYLDHTTVVPDLCPQI